MNSTYDHAPKFSYASRAKQTTSFMGGFLFGLLFLPVAMNMESSKDDMAGLYHLENPSRSIAQNLTQRMLREYGLKDVRTSELSEAWDELETLKRRFSQGLLLEVRSIRWRLEPSSWSQYHVVLESGARLVSVEDAKEIWRDTCVSEKVDAERDPKIENIKAKDGELLKAMVIEATETCTAELWSKLKGFEKYE